MAAQALKLQGTIDYFFGYGIKYAIHCIYPRSFSFKDDLYKDEEPESSVIVTQDKTGKATLEVKHSQDSSYEETSTKQATKVKRSSPSEPISTLCSTMKRQIISRYSPHLFAVDLYKP